MSLFNDIQNAAGDAAEQVQDTARSVPRQFDDTEGGGFADELQEIVDPTDRTSEETESDLRTGARLAQLLSPTAGFTSAGLNLSDYLDTQAGRTAPGSDPDADPDDEQTNPDPAAGAGFWEQVFRGNTPSEQAGEEADRAADWARSQAFDSPYITLAVIGIVLLVVLYLVRPLLTIGANVSG